MKYEKGKSPACISLDAHRTSFLLRFFFIFGRKRVWDSLSCSAVLGFPCVP